MPPQGTKLYSPICGECNFEGVWNNTIITVIDGEENSWDFYENGSYAKCGSCILWPSENWTSWGDWQAELFKDGITSLMIIMKHLY